tara:strand:+ start:3913 stop:4200 length:288 start_codon:yes stop_codon:yes gene_type:complete
MKTADATPYEIGKNYLIRTVTMIQAGRLKEVYEKELVLENASWVADTGRFGSALEHGIEKNNDCEIEMFQNNVIIGRGSIIDATIYNFSLPTQSK